MKLYKIPLLLSMIFMLVTSSFAEKLYVPITNDDGNNYIAVFGQVNTDKWSYQKILMPNTTLKPWLYSISLDYNNNLYVTTWGSPGDNLFHIINLNTGQQKAFTPKVLNKEGGFYKLDPELTQQIVALADNGLLIYATYTDASGNLDQPVWYHNPIDFTSLNAFQLNNKYKIKPAIPPAFKSPYIPGTFDLGAQQKNSDSLYLTEADNASKYSKNTLVEYNDITLQHPVNIYHSLPDFDIYQIVLYKGRVFAILMKLSFTDSAGKNKKATARALRAFYAEQQMAALNHQKTLSDGLKLTYKLAELLPDVNGEPTPPTIYNLKGVTNPVGLAFDDSGHTYVINGYGPGGISAYQLLRYTGIVPENTAPDEKYDFLFGDRYLANGIIMKNGAGS